MPEEQREKMKKGKSRSRLINDICFSNVFSICLLFSALRYVIAEARPALMTLSTEMPTTCAKPSGVRAPPSMLIFGAAHSASLMWKCPSRACGGTADVSLIAKDTDGTDCE